MPPSVRGESEVLQWVIWQCAGLGPMAGKLAHFLVYALGLALDSSSVYFFEDEGVLNRVALQGGTPGQVAVVQIPQFIAVDASNVYWTQYPTDGPSGVTGNVMQMPKAGGPQTVLASGHRLGSVAVDATSVYWVDFDGSAVKRVPIGGGDAVTLANGSMGEAMVVDEVSVYYWITDSDGTVGVLTKVPIAGCEPTTLVSGVQVPGAIAVDATSVYWIAGARVPPLSPGA